MAFDPQSAGGGALGITVREAMRYGVARGLFSNEAGMGSTPHAHALAKVAHPDDQGMMAMMGVFIDTFVVLTCTALVIVITGVWNSGITGTELAQTAFDTVFGSFGNIYIAICLFFFAFSTIIGWYFFGEANVKALFGAKYVKIYAAICRTVHRNRFRPQGEPRVEHVRHVQRPHGSAQPHRPAGPLRRGRRHCEK